MATTESNYNFNALFAECLKAAIAHDASHDPQRFTDSHFIEQWWYRRGTSYCFVFNKNITCTNMQYAELLSLLQLHVTSGGKRCPLHFRRPFRFQERVADVVNTLGDNTGETDWINSVVELYGPALRPIVLLSPYRGSCIVHLPPHMELDLPQLCAESGFIHSCGRNVYSSELTHATGDELKQRLQDYLATNGPAATSKLLFTAYSHEDFTAFDREDESFLRNGLDELKIHVEKCYLGEHSLVAVLHSLKEDFKSTLAIASPGDFRQQHDKLLKEENIDRDRTLWLIADRHIASSADRHARAPVFICYDQHYANKNAFHIMDEDKPAWIDHTTLPHSLAGAMLNVARARTSSKRVSVFDIFAGSGTVPLEAAKLSHVTSAGSDVELASNLVAQDNADFFSWNSRQIWALHASILQLLESPIAVPKRHETAEQRILMQDYSAALRLLELYANRDESAGFDRKIVTQLKGKTIHCRFIFYLMLKTYKRHTAALDRNAYEWSHAFRKQAKRMLYLLKLFAEQRELEEVDGSSQRGITVFQARFSKGVAIPRQTIQRYAKKVVIEHMDILQGAPKDREFDIIVADPPYGFNTDENREKLAHVYANAIRWMIRSLKKEGQLVLCLPAASFTGREIPGFCTSQWITQQILAESQALDRRVIREGGIIPEPNQLFDIPYYWEASRALRRAILHFHFQ